MRGLMEGLEIISTCHTKGNEYNRAFEIIKMSISSIEFQLKSNRVLCCVLFCLELDNLIPNLIWKSKGPRITEMKF